MDTGKIMHMDEQLEKVPGGTVLPYVVQPGDSLRMIANKYHIPVQTERRSRLTALRKPLLKMVLRWKPLYTVAKTVRAVQ